MRLVTCAIFLSAVFLVSSCGSSRTEYWKLKKENAALRAENDSLRLKVEDVEFGAGRLLTEARVCLQKQRYQEAKDRLTALLQRHPHSEEAFEAESLMARADRGLEEKVERERKEGRSSNSLDIARSFPLFRIAGAGRTEVSKILGPPTGWEETKLSRWTGPNSVGPVETFPTGSYIGGAVEVLFIDGKADWITIYPPSPGLEFSPEAVAKYLGLTLRPPYVSNYATIRWEHIQGLLDVSAFPQSENGALVQYLHARARTR